MHFALHTCFSLPYVFQVMCITYIVQMQPTCRCVKESPNHEISRGGRDHNERATNLLKLFCSFSFCLQLQVVWLCILNTLLQCVYFSPPKRREFRFISIKNLTTVSTQVKSLETDQTNQNIFSPFCDWPFSRVATVLWEMQHCLNDYGERYPNKAMI